MASQRVTFTATLRARPIVLTHHQLRSLSATAGRDVSAELQAISGEPVEVASLRKLMSLLRSRLTPTAEAGHG